ncbi:uncharacterized protein LOC129602072 [Paramacrobiotus metropolitanus]|uniref:uncharacterized protein LOC129602072 n=1 Tax=Paramacrobiotus metropolitanus TaxID=2943436 RepID=UPI0024465685|nr:uncharacterized protein LOC129602072 [Paramacrobiotus metropolitanus]
MKETGICHAKFPKAFCPETNPNKDGYPEYRRRDSGITITVGTRTVDNQWIVPYNPYLLLKYNCHINVEICATIKSFKYLYKYIFKGHDVALITMTDSSGKKILNMDEIQAFVDSRYISAPEAHWRLSKYEMHAMSHTVVRMPVHKPNEQDVYFAAGEEETAV